MSKQTGLYPYNRVLFSHEKEWSAYICCRKDDPWKHYTKCKKPDAKAHEWYGSTYLQYPKQANLTRQKIKRVVVTDEGNVGWLPMCTGFLLEGDENVLTLAVMATTQLGECVSLKFIKLNGLI